MNNIQTDILNIKNKTALILGVATKDSIAYHIAKTLQQQGVQVYATYQAMLEKIARPLLENAGMQALECDVASDTSIKSLYESLPALDMIVYGPAFANKDELAGDFMNMRRENFAQALDISCYSMIPVINYATLNPGASILALTYHGSTKVVPCYDLMGIAKSALEATVRYMAFYLGEKNIRVNALSAGPLRTLAASRGIRGYNVLEEYYAKNAPLERNITHTDAALSALYLLSDMSNGVTGEIHYVDAGYNIMGVKNPRTDDVDVSTYRVKHVRSDA